MPPTAARNALTSKSKLKKHYNSKWRTWSAEAYNTHFKTSWFTITLLAASLLYYLLYDSNQTYFVLSVYGVHSDVIKEGDQLTLLDPYFRDVDFTWKKHYQFTSIQLDFYEQVLVNGKAL